MDFNLTGNQRFWSVMAIAWVLIWVFESRFWRYRFPNGGWEVFLGIGIGPIALVLAFIWVYKGYQNDRKK
jgi:hypothetical protein